MRPTNRPPNRRESTPFDAGPEADRAARFSDLFDDYAELLLNYFLRRVANRSDAADLLANVFLVAWRRIDAIPTGEESKLWLYGVARNTLANHRRRGRREVALAGRLRDELATGQRPDAPEDLASRTVVDALRRLRPLDREILMLVGWDGLGPAEAAVLLGIDPGTARVRIHRARGRLARQLADDDPAGTRPHHRMGRLRVDPENVINLDLEGHQ